MSTMSWKLHTVRKLHPGESKGKSRFVAFFQNSRGNLKKTPFGHRDYECYLDHKDPVRRSRYRMRHKKDLQTKDPTRAGYLSYYLLWGNSTRLEENIRNYRRMFRM